MAHVKQVASTTQKPYSGLSRSVVIAIDVGTTFSGVSYSILEPGEIPKIYGVTRFPGQEHVAGNSKIPSVIYYDKYGTIMATGAEADSSSIVAQAEDEGWIKAELFKLRLRPRQMQLNMNGMRLSPLPRGKSPVQVFGDYLGYLYNCTRSFISDTHANGIALWNSVESDIQFVLSHPNGWEGPQQTRMRKAAVYGKLVPDTDAGRARIRFVTEGEASLHACVLNGLAGDVLSNPSKHGFLIADAGGGTLDISSYAIKGTAPLVIEEIAPPDCIFAGSVFVSRRAREFLEEKLKHSKYGTPDSLDHITRKFDETTKRLFRDRNELQFIPFGSPLDKDLAVGIRNGQLRLSGNEVANLFEPSVDAAVNAIKAQIEGSKVSIRSVFLVGGYAASPWLFGQLQERLSPHGITVNRPDAQTSKAVADGAIGFYCDHYVSARMSKFMYGVEFLRELDPKDPDHLARKEKLCELPSGPKLLPDAFDCILARSVRVKESTVFTRKYCTELTNLSMLSVFEVEIWCYRGGNEVPKWINREDDAFSTLCVVQADLSLLNGSAEPKVGKNGKKYWTIVFSVEIHFGLTEFKARIKWMDNGQVRYGPAVIVYNERGSRLDDDDADIYPEDDSATFNNGRSDRQRSSPASRSRTPIDPYYPPSSRRTSTAAAPEAPRMERSSSKGYSPSIAPSSRTYSSSRNDVNRGSDGERGGSDSDRRKSKKDYIPEDRDRGFGPTSGAATPIDRARSVSSAYGTPAMAIGKVPSSNGGTQGELLSSNWAAPHSTSVPSRPPSAKPQSRSPSMYGGSSAPAADHASPGPQDFASPPRSAIDEHRQSQLWDAPPTPQAAALDAILERPRSPYVSKPHSPAPPPPAHPPMETTPSAYAQGSPYGRPASNYEPEGHYGQPSSAYGGDPNINISRPRSPYAPSHADRPKSPFFQEPQTAIGRSASPFIDRPKSGVEGSFFGDRPKSAFGEAPAIFGDSGPAADIGDSASAPLFGDPPASVFGETAAPGATDSWGFSAATPPAAQSPVTPKSGKSKRKGSAAATPSLPASGLASRASPNIGANKSPFGQTAEVGLFDEPVVAAAATASPSAFGSSGGLWGSKAPSPMDKKDKDKALSPLNPASQFHDEPAPPADTWGFENKGTSGEGESWGKSGDGWGTSGGGDGWNSASFGDSQPLDTKAASKEPSRVPSPAPITPVAETPIDDTSKETAAGGKKKKKKGTAAAKAQEEKDEEDRKKAEAAAADKEAADKAEAAKLQAEIEMEAAKAQEEAARLDKERLDKEEEERITKEIAHLEAKQKEDEEKAERERIEEEEKKKAAEPTSLFGNTTSLFSGGHFSSSSLSPPDQPWTSTDTGGGDDGWGTSFGTAASKKKKGKNATPAASAKPSAFGFGSSSWGNFGSSPGDDTAKETSGISPKPSPKPLASELPPSTDLGINFGAATSLGFSFGGDPAPAKAPSRASSPVPATEEPTKTPAAEQTDPLDIVSPTGEEGDTANDLADLLEGGDADGDEQKAGDDWANDTTSKKKKKKKGGNAGGAETNESPAPTPIDETAPEAGTGGGGGGGGKKKGKKKK